MVGQFTWHRFAAVQIWVFVLFLIYTTVAELNARLGDGELTDVLHRSRDVPSLTSCGAGSSDRSTRGLSRR